MTTSWVRVLSALGRCHVPGSSAARDEAVDAAGDDDVDPKVGPVPRGTSRDRASSAHRSAFEPFAHLAASVPVAHARGVRSGPGGGPALVRVATRIARLASGIEGSGPWRGAVRCLVFLASTCLRLPAQVAPASG